MNPIKKFWVEKTWHNLFEIGVFLKGINGIFEIIVGSLILFVNKNYVMSKFFLLTRAELAKDPNDKVINFIAHFLQNLSNDARLFAAAYVLAHGVINLFLAIQLFRNKLHAYLVSMSLMFLFVVYQIYRISHTHSKALIAITVFDILFIMLTAHEYRYKVELRELGEVDLAK